jgi:branched-chain amino acid transport system permease protein
MKSSPEKARLGCCCWLLGLAFPFFAKNDYYLTVMATAYIFAIATMGLNLITGYTGQFNLAHSGFMAVGAYTVGILTVDHQVPFWIAFALSGVRAAVLGFFVGLVSLRLKGHYFSIFTLCVGYIMFLLIEKWESLTHGTVGIMGIPAPTPSPASSSTRRVAVLPGAVLPGAGQCGSCIASPTRCWGAPSWRSAMATPGRSAGHSNLMRNKLLAFMLSVFYAGLAGGSVRRLRALPRPGLASVGPPST